MGLWVEDSSLSYSFLAFLGDPLLSSKSSDVQAALANERPAEDARGRSPTAERLDKGALKGPQPTKLKTCSW